VVELQRVSEFGLKLGLWLREHVSFLRQRIGKDFPLRVLEPIFQYLGRFQRYRGPASTPRGTPREDLLDRRVGWGVS